MTVSVTTNTQSYSGNDVATSFPFTFRTHDAAHVKGYVIDVNSNLTTLVYNTDYTVALNGDGTGTVTYPVSGDPLASGETLRLVREVPHDQGVDLTIGGPYDPEVVEDALDDAVFQVQQIDEQLGRSLTAPQGEGALNDLPDVAGRKGKYLGFNTTTGQPEAFNASGAATDAANVTYSPPWTNAQDRSVDDRLSDFMTVNDFTDIDDAIVQSKEVLLPDGTTQISTILNLNASAANTLRGAGPQDTIIQATDSGAHVSVRAVRKAIRDLQVDGNNLGLYGIYNPDANAANELVIDNVQISDFTTYGLYDGNADAGRYVGGYVTQSGLTSDPGTSPIGLYLKKDFYVGDHVVVGNIWGTAIVCSGSEARITLNGVRVNFCYDGFIKATDSANVKVDGGYFENAAVHKDINGTNTTNTASNVYAFDADNGKMVVTSIHCTSGNHVEGVFRTVNSGRMSVLGDIEFKGSAGGTDPYMFVSDATGKINLNADFEMDSPTTKFSGIVDFEPKTSGFILGCMRYPVLKKFDGTSTTGLTANNGSLTTDATTYKTDGSSIKFTGNGTSGNNYFSFTIDPAELDEKVIVVSAAIRLTAGGTSNIDAYIEITGGGVDLTAIGDGGNVTTAGTWYYMQSGCVVTDDTQTITVKIISNNSASNSNDVLYTDRIYVNALDNTYIGV